MALDKSQLESDLLSTFQDMKSAGENAKDSDFSAGVATACKDFVEGGNIIIVAGGKVSSGTFAGGGQGNISLKDSLMKSAIDTATATMKTLTSGGDAILASAIFSGLSAMLTAGEVEVDVEGTTVSESGSAVPPSSGTTKGTGLTCTDSGFVASLNSVFSDMNSKTSEEGFDGDEYLAEKLADIINTLVATGTVITSGEGELEGVTGTGAIS